MINWTFVISTIKENISKLNFNYCHTSGVQSLGSKTRFIAIQPPFGMISKSVSAILDV